MFSVATVHKKQTQLHQDHTNGLLIRELMQKYNLSKASVYRYLKEA